MANFLYIVAVILVIACLVVFVGWCMRSNSHIANDFGYRDHSQVHPEQ